PVVPRPLHDHHRGAGLDPRLVPGGRVHHPDADPPHERSALAGSQDADRAAKRGRVDGVWRAHRLLPHRRSARIGGTLAGHEGEAPDVALPVLRRTLPMRSRAQVITTEKEVNMKRRTLLITALALAVAFGPWTPVPAQDKTIFMPLLVYRTGPFAPNG